MVGIPNGLAVRVRGTMEVFVLRTAFTLVSLLAIVAMFAPGLLHRLEPDLWADGGR